MILPEEDRKNFGELPNFDDDGGFRFTPIKFNFRPIQTDDLFSPFFSGFQGKAHLFLYSSVNNIFIYTTPKKKKKLL